METKDIVNKKEPIRSGFKMHFVKWLIVAWGFIQFCWIACWMLVFSIIKLISSIPLFMIGSFKSAKFNSSTCFMYESKEDY